MTTILAYKTLKAKIEQVAKGIEYPPSNVTFEKTDANIRNYVKACFLNR